MVGREGEGGAKNWGSYGAGLGFGLSTTDGILSLGDGPSEVLSYLRSSCVSFFGYDDEDE